MICRMSKKQFMFVLGGKVLPDPEALSSTKHLTWVTRASGHFLASLWRLLFLCQDPRNDSVEGVEAYDVDSRKWRAAHPMPCARRGLAAAMLGGRIYGSAHPSSPPPNHASYAGTSVPLPYLQRVIILA